MRFEIAYPSGVKNEVELEGTTALLGRDPTCDLVLNDVKCSRQHAIVEAGPGGMRIRDNGSANGIYVNGRKVDEAPLAEGDTIRLGQIIVTVLVEDFAPTVAMSAEEAEKHERDEDDEPTEPVARDALFTGVPKAQPAPHPPPSRPANLAGRSTTSSPPRSPQKPPGQPAGFRPAPTPSPPVPRRPERGSASSPPRARKAPPPAARRRGGAATIQRPATVTLIASSWLLGVLLFGSTGLGLAFFGGWEMVPAVLVAFCGVCLAAIAGAMGFGLWTLSPWARYLQLGLSGLGVLSCVGTLPSIAILVYMLRPEVQVTFSGAQDTRQLTPEQSEVLSKARSDTPFLIAILAAFVMSALLGGAVTWGAYWYLDQGNPLS